MTFFKVFCIVILVATCAVYSDGHCKKCSENEFCHIIFWFLSRCIRFQLEGEYCNSRHRICARGTECTIGTCQSMFVRTKTSPTSLLPSTTNEFLSSSTMTIIQTEKPVAAINSQSYDDGTNLPTMSVLLTSMEIPEIADDSGTTILTKSSESQPSTNSTAFTAPQTTIYAITTNYDNGTNPPTMSVSLTSTEISEIADDSSTTILTKSSESQPSSENSTVSIAPQTTIATTQKHYANSRIPKDIMDNENAI